MDKDEDGKELALELAEVLERHRKGNTIPGAVRAFGVISRIVVSSVMGKDGDTTKKAVKKARKEIFKYLKAMMRKGLVDDM